MSTLTRLKPEAVLLGGFYQHFVIANFVFPLHWPDQIVRRPLGKWSTPFFKKGRISMIAAYIYCFPPTVGKQSKLLRGYPQWDILVHHRVMARLSSLTGNSSFLSPRLTTRITKGYVEHHGRFAIVYLDYTRPDHAPLVVFFQRKLQISPFEIDLILTY